jgi:hypothetical protein
VAEVALKLQIQRSIALGTFPTTQTANSPDLPRAEQLIREGKYQEAYDLLAPFETSMSNNALHRGLTKHPIGLLSMQRPN